MIDKSSLIRVAIVLLTALSMVIAFYATCHTVTGIATHYAKPSNSEDHVAKLAVFGMFLGVPSGVVAVWIVWLMRKYLMRRKDR